MKRITSILLAAATAVFLLPPAESRDLFVSKTGDNSTGESWETSYNSIGQALEDANPEDTVHVAAGVYIESVTIPLGVSLLGGHPLHSSGSILYNRNPRVYTTTIGATEEFTTIRLNPNSVLDGFQIFGRLFQEYQGGPSGSTKTIVRTCRIVYEHPEIQFPAISASMPCCDPLLILEECFIRYSTGQDSPFMDLSMDCRIVNTIFSYDLPIETPPMILAGSGPFDLVNCVIYDRGKTPRMDGFEATQPDFIMSGLNMISNQPFRPKSPRMGVGNSIYKHPLHPLGGNRDVDPQFLDPDNDDFLVHPTSPAIDMGRVVETLVSRHDFLGRPRVVDIPGVGKSGDDAIDIGAYEMQLDEYRLRSDLNGDGGVDAKDLLIFSQDWHRTSSP